MHIIHTVTTLTSCVCHFVTASSPLASPSFPLSIHSSPVQVRPRLRVHSAPQRQGG